MIRWVVHWIKETDVDAFNEVATLRAWLLQHDDKDTYWRLPSFNQFEVNTIIDKYKTPFIILPITAKKDNYYYNWIQVVDLRNGRSNTLVSNISKGINRKILHKAALYDALIQIIYKRKY